MIQNLFAALGIGSATVETKLTSAVVMPGDLVRGTVVLNGGTVDQQIEALNLFVMTIAEVEQHNQEIQQSLPLMAFSIAQRLSIRAGSRSELPFEFQLHPEIPLTDLSRAGLPHSDPALSVQATGPRNRAALWLHTGLNIESGVDSTDKDPLFTRPSGPQLLMLQALERLGLIFVTSDVEYGRLGRARAGSLSCYQEFEYRPPFMRLPGIEELEVSFVPGARSTKVIFQLDRRRRRDTARSLTMQHNTFQQIDWAFEVQQLLRQ